jgi:hypothetical protein
LTTLKQQYSLDEQYSVDDMKHCKKEKDKDKYLRVSSLKLLLLKKRMI